MTSLALTEEVSIIKFKTYSYEEAIKESLNYLKGDDFAASVFVST